MYEDTIIISPFVVSSVNYSYVYQTIKRWYDKPNRTRIDS